MTLSRTARVLLRLAMMLGLAVIYVPLLVVLVNSFNSDRSFVWPPPGWTTQWWVRAWENDGVRAALWTSTKAGLSAMAIAPVLGTLVASPSSGTASSAATRVSLLVVRPIALPGIVTGIALDSAFRTVAGPLGV